MTSRTARPWSFLLPLSTLLLVVLCLLPASVHASRTPLIASYTIDVTLDVEALDLPGLQDFLAGAGRRAIAGRAEPVGDIAAPWSNVGEIWIVTNVGQLLPKVRQT
jgi:hypothetical protein